MVPNKRDLRSGRSIWLSYPAPRVSVLRPLPKITSDVLVIGAGISGALIAEMLTGEGLDVAIVDRRGAVQGSTLASTALVQYELDTPLLELRRMIGRDRADRAWQRCKLAVEALAHRTRELGIDCAAVGRNALYLAGTALNSSALEDEGEARRSIGLETVHLDRRRLRERFGLSRAGALLSFGNLAINPRQMTAGYLKVAISRGARLYAPDTIVDVETSGKGVEAHSEKGRVYRATAVVYASGYELPKAITPASLRVVSTWALATRPQPRRLWPEEPLIWEASDPYLYMRTTPDGRILCGGEDEALADDEARDALTPKKIERIRRKLRKLLPDADDRPATSWSAFFGSSATGLAQIGRVPGHPRLYAAMGYGGNGITFSRIAAEILTSALTGRRDSDADVFALDAVKRSKSR